MYETHHIRTTFGSKVYVVVARRTFPNQNTQNTPRADYFWHLKCRKNAHRCGAKCEVHFEIKINKLCHFQTTFGSYDVEKVHVIVARSTFRRQNIPNTPRSDHFWKLRYRKSTRRCGAKHISKSKYTKYTTFGPFLDIQSSFRVADIRGYVPCQK